MRWRRALLLLSLLALPAAAIAARPAAAPVPPNDSTQVPRIVAPGFRFADRQSADSITADTLHLLTPIGVPAAGLVKSTGDLAVIEPSAPLAGCTTYTLELAPTAAGRGASPLRSRFTTACSRWRPPVQIDDSRTARRVDLPVSSVEVAAGADGDFVAVWFQDDGRRRAVMASHFNPATDFWSAPQDIDLRGPNAGASSIPAIASDAGGRVTAVWFQAVGGRNAIVANRLVGDTWRTPQRLDNPALPGDATNPQLAADANGNVTVVWQQSNGRHTGIYAAHWQQARQRWLPAQELDRLSAHAYNPVVAAAPDGRVVAAWQQGAPGHEAVYAAAFRGSSASWSAPARASRGGRPARNPALVGSRQGDFTAAWVQGEGSAGRIATSRLVDGATSWSKVEVMHSAAFAGPALSPALTTDVAGNVTLAWEQADRPDPSGARDAILASRLSAKTRQWTPPRRIDDPTLRSAGNPALVVDAAGNVSCAWYQDGPQGLQVQAARFDPTARQWTGPVPLSDPRATVQASFPALAVDAAGSVVAVWQQYNGWRTIAAAAWLP